MDLTRQHMIPWIKKSIKLTYKKEADSSGSNHLCQPTKSIFDWDKVIDQIKRCDDCKQHWRAYIEEKHQLNAVRLDQQRSRFICERPFCFQVKNSFFNHAHITFLVRQASTNLHSLRLNGNLLSPNLTRALIRHCPNLNEIDFGHVHSTFCTFNGTELAKLLKHFGPQLKSFGWKELNWLYASDRIDLMINYLDPKQINSISFSYYDEDQLVRMFNNFCSHNEFSYIWIGNQSKDSKNRKDSISLLKQFPNHRLVKRSLTGQNGQDFKYLEDKQVVESLKCLALGSKVTFPKSQYNRLLKLSALNELDIRSMDKPLLKFISQRLWYLKTLSLTAHMNDFLDSLELISSVSLLDTLRLNLFSLQKSKPDKLSPLKLVRQFDLCVQCEVKDESEMSVWVEMLPELMPKLQTLFIKCHHLPMEQLIQLTKLMPLLKEVKLLTDKQSAHKFTSLSGLVSNNTQFLVYPMSRKV